MVQYVQQAMTITEAAQRLPHVLCSEDMGHSKSDEYISDKVTHPVCSRDPDMHYL